MENDFKERKRYRDAQKRVKQIKSFYIHLLVYLFINGALLVVNINLGAEEVLEFSHFYPAIFWGIGLLAHWASVFLPGYVFSNEWEEKAIRKEMEREKKKEDQWE